MYIQASGSWDKQGAKILNVGTSAHPVTKMLAVSPDKIWCSVHNCVKIIDTAALEIEASSSFSKQNTLQVYRVVHLVVEHYSAR